VLRSTTYFKVWNAKVLRNHSLPSLRAPAEIGQLLEIAKHEDTTIGASVARRLATLQRLACIGAAGKAHWRAAAAGQVEALRVDARSCGIDKP
jgi:hypothetical protein